MRRVLVCTAVGLLLAGCQTVSYRTNLAGGGKRYEEPASYFLWGLVGEKVVDLRRICPGGVARWKNQQSAVDAILGWISLGIYVPRTIVVECAGPNTFPSVVMP
ncbi:MAG: Bor/Iss family lipoprotein [Myxococcaceae bacterium]